MQFALATLIFCYYSPRRTIIPDGSERRPSNDDKEGNVVRINLFSHFPEEYWEKAIPARLQALAYATDQRRQQCLPRQGFIHICAVRYLITRPSQHSPNGQELSSDKTSKKKKKNCATGGISSFFSKTYYLPFFFVCHLPYSGPVDINSDENCGPLPAAV